MASKLEQNQDQYPEIPVINMDKLRKLTNSRDRRSPSVSLDFSKFASENFDQQLRLTNVASNKKTRTSSKLLYNEVQRNSIYFGITGAEMKAFYKMKTGGKSGVDDMNGKRPTVFQNSGSKPTKTAYVQISDSFETAPDTSKMTVEPEDKIKPLVVDEKSLIKLSPLPPIQNEATKETGLRKEKRDDTESKSISESTIYLTPKSNQGSFPRTPQPTSSMNSNISVSPSPSLNKTDGTQMTNILKKASSKNLGILNYRSSSRSKLTSRASLTPSSIGTPTLRRTPSQKECHSVEDTLLADEEFKDFTVPKRQSSYYESSIDQKFSFELRNSSSRTSLNPSVIDANNGQICQRCSLLVPSAPTTPTHKQSISVLTNSPAARSPLVTFKRSNSNKSLDSNTVPDRGLSPVQRSRSTSQRSPIRIITEEEILDDYSLM